MIENDFKKMKELEVIRIAKDPNVSSSLREAARTFLYNKYQEMIHKHWWMLQKQLNDSDLINNLKEDYYSEAQIAFFVALDKTDPSRIYDENFKLMQMASWYIGNSRKKIAKEAIKKGKEKSITSIQDLEDEDGLSIDPDVEFSNWNRVGYKESPEYVCELHDSENRCKSIVQKYLKIWDPVKVEIYKRRLNKESRIDIAKALNLPTTKVYKFMKEMYNDLAKDLVC